MYGVSMPMDDPLVAAVMLQLDEWMRRAMEAGRENERLKAELNRFFSTDGLHWLRGRLPEPEVVQK